MYYVVESPLQDKAQCLRHSIIPLAIVRAAVARPWRTCPCAPAPPSTASHDVCTFHLPASENVVANDEALAHALDLIVVTVKRFTLDPIIVTLDELLVCQISVMTRRDTVGQERWRFSWTSARVPRSQNLVHGSSSSAMGRAADMGVYGGATRRATRSCGPACRGVNPPIKIPVVGVRARIQHHWLAPVCCAARRRSKTRIREVTGHA